MKKFLFPGLALGLLAALPGRAQSVGIGTPAAAPPDASAALEVRSTTQGMLVPRMLSGQRTAINPAALGLLVYQTDAPAGFYFYDGSGWVSLSGGGSGGTTLPSQAGNSGKVLTTDGTTTSWTGYDKETLTVLAYPKTGANNAAGTGTYTIPAFTDGVKTQTIVVTGTSSQQYNLVLPNPVNVPDGSRIIVKKYALNDGESTGLVRFSYNFPAPTAATTNVPMVNGSTGTGSTAYAYLTDGSGSSVVYPTRVGSMWVKITHIQLGNFTDAKTYHSWVPLLGYGESRTNN